MLAYWRNGISVGPKFSLQRPTKPKPTTNIVSTDNQKRLSTAAKNRNYCLLRRFAKHGLALQRTSGCCSYGWHNADNSVLLLFPGSWFNESFSFLVGRRRCGNSPTFAWMHIPVKEGEGGLKFSSHDSPSASRTISALLSSIRTLVQAQTSTDRLSPTNGQHVSQHLPSVLTSRGYFTNIKQHWHTYLSHG